METFSVVFKVVPSPSKKTLFVRFNESPLEVVKNAFYIMIFWIRKPRLISNFKSEQQVITIRILSHIPRKNGNRTMKFVQLIECNRNIFLEKSYTKCGGEIIPRSFFKNKSILSNLDRQFQMF